MADDDDDNARFFRPDNGQRKGGRFQPGNPGRPKGARDRRTVALEALFKENGEQVAQATIAAAMAGDMTAARMVLDRAFPVRKMRPVSIDLPKIETAADLLTAQGLVVDAMSRGEITPDEATEIGKVLEHIGSAIERRDLEARIAKLEEKETFE